MRDATVSSVASQCAEKESLDPADRDNENFREILKTSNENRIAHNIAECNSYKFARPRFYTPNDFQGEKKTVFERLKFLAQNVGPKTRTPAYNDSILRMLQLSHSKHMHKKKQRDIVLNSTVVRSGLKMANFEIDNLKIPALVDTGSTDCFSHKLKTKRSYL
jgi:hypothetical protein